MSNFLGMKKRGWFGNATTAEDIGFIIVLVIIVAVISYIIWSIR